MNFVSFFRSCHKVQSSNFTGAGRLLFLMRQQNECVRQVTTTNTCQSNKKDLSKIFTSKREGKFLKKILSNSGMVKAKHFTYSQPASNHLMQFGLSDTKKKAVPNRVKRRMEVLNNLFVEQITGLLATGEVSPGFLGLGIQISKVQIIPDFSSVHVFWYASGTENDTTIEKLLEETAGHLRHTLTQLRVIGIVPPIRFFRDSTFSKLQEVETLLSRCDFGPHFVPTLASISIRAQKVPGEKRNSEGVDEPLSNDETVKLFDDETRPLTDIMEMRHDILGIKHDLIMSSIKKSMTKRQDRILSTDAINAIPSISDLPYDSSVNESADVEGHLEESHQQRQKDFIQYLKQRQAQRARLLKNLSAEAKERDFVLSQKEEKLKNQMANRLEELDIGGYDDDDPDSETLFEEDEKYFEEFRKDFN